jgi:hypothetical protein
MADPIREREARRTGASRIVFGGPTVGDWNPKIETEEDDDGADHACPHDVARLRYDHATYQRYDRCNRKPGLAFKPLAAFYRFQGAAGFRNRFHHPDNLVGFLNSALRDQPTWRLRQLDSQHDANHRE